MNILKSHRFKIGVPVCFTCELAKDGYLFKEDMYT